MTLVFKIILFSFVEMKTPRKETSKVLKSASRPHKVFWTDLLPYKHYVHRSED